MWNGWSSTIFVFLQKPTPKPRQHVAQAEKKVSFQDLNTTQMEVSVIILHLCMLKHKRLLISKYGQFAAELIIKNTQLF